MKIGIDFDNTIINYEDVFFKTAVDYGYINQDAFQGSNTKKNDVKTYLINLNREDDWTRIQGLVYGEAIELAKPYCNLNLFLDFLLKNNHQFFIVSHKTKYPFIGKKVDLHQSAKKWINIHLKKYFSDNFYFEETIEKKIDRINKLKPDFFIDDLEKILLHKKLSKKINKILFSNQKITKNSFLMVTNEWIEVLGYFKK
jgi:hypothetical protein